MRKLIFVLAALFFLISHSNAQSVTPKKWTFLIYLNGKNSLDMYGEANIKAMEQVGSNDQVNVVVEWGSYITTKTLRLLIQKSTNPSYVTSPILEDLGAVDMGDYKTLEDFIQWGVKNFPAEHYFIDVWNHGGGWHLSRQSSKCTATHLKSHFTDISWDDLTGHAITTEQLGDVMRHASQMMGHKVDIYGSDACLMAMAEVADQMHGAVDYYVGSEEVIPALGWPYAEFLSRWQAIQNPSASEVSKILVDEYVKSYQGGSGGSHNVTFSAFDMTKLDNLNAALSHLSADVRHLKTEEKAKVIKAAQKTQTFMSGDYLDLIDLTKRLSAANVAGINLKNLEEVQVAAAQLIIANAGTPYYARATGVSIWFPTNSNEFNEYVKRYQGLQFNIDTGWGKALNALFAS